MLWLNGHEKFGGGLAELVIVGEGGCAHVVFALAPAACAATAFVVLLTRCWYVAGGWKSEDIGASDLSSVCGGSVLLLCCWLWRLWRCDGV